ncbi:MAG TPA: DedA family protein, partial [Candidatus Spyradosoma merdigallinarum]|nr:DedA family protein [Candidatus Spyradosoma merdigallinarum]
MAELIEWCFEHVSYWTVAFFMALENSLVPFPSEAIVPPAGYKAAA